MKQLLEIKHDILVFQGCSNYSFFAFGIISCAEFWRELITYWPPCILIADPVVIPLAIRLRALLKIRLKVCWDMRIDLAASF